MRLLCPSFCSALLVISLTTLIAPDTHAAWTPGGTPLCTAAQNQEHPSMASDGAGGAIVSWQDFRSGGYDVYAQRINASGTVVWTTNGVGLCTFPGDQGDWPRIVSDFAGGGIVTWGDWRGGVDEDAYAQRVNSSGVVQWTTDGVALCDTTGDQRTPAVAARVSGGAIFAWQDYRSGSGYDIYAQSVDPSGGADWTHNGVAICTATGDQVSPEIVTDGSGGAVIVWQDQRSGSYDIYAQRINASGTALWAPDGVAVCTASNDQRSPVIVRTASGDFILAWTDKRTGSDDIYGQMIDLSGLDQWTAGGAALCSATGDQGKVVIERSGLGGAVMAWQDLRSGVADIYAQRVNAAGTKLWGINGVAVCTATGSQVNPAIASDGSGGAVIVWRDERTGDLDIYAQRMNSSGTVQWTTDGEPVSTVLGWQNDWPKVVSDGDGGGVVSWGDERSDVDEDVYGTLITGNGNIGSDPVPISAPAVLVIAIAMLWLGTSMLRRGRMGAR